MVVYSGKVSIKVGADVGTGKDITNIKRINWRRVTDIKPQTVMSTVIPISWHQGHKHIEGELHVLSEAHDAFADYLKEDADNVVIPYAVATIVDTVGASRTATFTGFLLLGCDESYVDGEDTILIYRFVAYKVVEAPV